MILISLINRGQFLKSLVEGFRCGANDYIIKPFSIKELIARIDLHLLASSNAQQEKDELKSIIIEKESELEEVKELKREFEDKYGTTRLDDDTVETIMKEVTTLIEQEYHLGYEITVKTLADKLHIATYELSQAINRKTGYNFNSFVNYHRIQKAKGILKNPDNNYKSILEVSFEVGFNSKVSFNRAFKIFENTTPLKFRKNL